MNNPLASLSKSTVPKTTPAAQQPSPAKVDISKGLTSAKNAAKPAASEEVKQEEQDDEQGSKTDANKQKQTALAKSTPVAAFGARADTESDDSDDLGGWNA